MQLAQYCLNIAALAHITKREAAAMRYTLKRITATHDSTRRQDRLTRCSKDTIQVCEAGATHEERWDKLAAVKGDEKQCVGIDLSSVAAMEFTKFMRLLIVDKQARLVLGHRKTMLGSLALLVTPIAGNREGDLFPDIRLHIVAARTLHGKTSDVLRHTTSRKSQCLLHPRRHFGRY